MNTSDTISDLAAALAKAQGAFENPAKDRTVKVKSKKTGVEYSFSYATFSAVLDTVRKPMADNGLSFVQTTGTDEQGYLITTRLLHSSGQWMEFNTPVFVSDEGGPQAFGSGVTYAKRYALTSLLGVTADEDDDGNSAEGNQFDMRSRPPNAPRPQAPQRPAQPSSGQRAISASVNDEAAETFTSQSIEAIGKLRHQEELGAWWRTNQRHLERLQAKYPALYDRIAVAADRQRDNLPHVTQAAE